MLSPRFLPTLLALLLFPGSGGALLWAQSEVAVLRGARVNPEERTSATSSAQPFDFSRRQIYFAGAVDGQPVNLILDTGMPGLLLNDRGAGTAGADAGAKQLGTALGGGVRLANRKIRSLRMAGRDHGQQWAQTLDLRPVEARTDRPVDGYVGYDLLRGSDLRIDYAARTFRLLPSARRPLHDGEAPARILRLEFVDHLPVVTLRIGKRRYRFAIDTGASVNLIDVAAATDFEIVNRYVNLQGLDGSSADHGCVLLPPVRDLPLSADQRAFVRVDLSHLQTPGAPPIHGLLGSDFLSAYTVGVDYRRRRLLLWE